MSVMCAVVIGFQIVYFYREVTQKYPQQVIFLLLWLAFKLFIFTEKSHSKNWKSWSINSCDWLSNCLFLQRSHTQLLLTLQLKSVVIGFQIVYFYREVTHYESVKTKNKLLWLAFKLFIFTEKSHKTHGLLKGHISCDWLSNCLFLQRSHTKICLRSSSEFVVIGFQIVYFYREVTQINIALFW